MTKNDFINIFQSAYIFDDEDYDNQIEIIGSKKEKNASNFWGDKIVVDLEVDSCNIYRVFTYEEYDSLLRICEINREKLLLLQALGKSYEESPKLDFYDGMGCPFVEEYVGYFDVEYNQKRIKNILNAFETAFVLYQEIKIDKTYLMENFKTEYEIYLENEEDVKYAHRILMGSDYCAISEKLSSKYEDMENVYVDGRGAFVTGFGNDSLKKIANFMELQTYKTDDIYFGEKYCLAHTKELVVSIDINYIKRINEFLDMVNIEDRYSLEYEMGQFGIIVKVPYGDFWAVIFAIKGDIDIFVVNERKYIQRLHKTLLPFVSPELLYEEHDFSKLDDSAFEKLCRDLLIDIGFLNVTQRGKTRASDGGVDLEADMMVETILGEQKQHWIFQCKHTKVQIDRKDISEISDLLKEFDANGYGLFYSGMLSPQTLDRIKNKNKEINIQYWSKGELEILLRKYQDTATRYFGI